MSGLRGTTLDELKKQYPVLLDEFRREILGFPTLKEERAAKKAKAKKATAKKEKTAKGKK